jgi:hypothetical protein
MPPSKSLNYQNKCTRDFQILHCDEHHERELEFPSLILFAANIERLFITIIKICTIIRASLEGVYVR